MHENTPPEVTLNTEPAPPRPGHDRLDEIAVLLEQPREYFYNFARPIDADYREQVAPVLRAVELLAAEVRDLRDRL